jgi:ribosome-binding factor A
MAQKRRTYRVAEKIRSIVATELLQLDDPRLMLVTITSVHLSPDLRHARIYWMVSLGAERIPGAEEAFRELGSHVRHVLGKKLGTRYVPEVKFFYDDTLDTVEQVERLLDTTRTSEEISDEEPGEC